MIQILEKCFNTLFFTLLLSVILSIRPTIVSAQIPEKVGCYSLDGRTFHKCGDRWTDNRNGVICDCVCNCPSQGEDCKPRSQAADNSTNSGSDPSIQLVQGMVGSFMQGFMNGLSRQNNYNAQQQEKLNQEEKQRQLAEAQHKEEAKREWQKFQDEEAIKNQMDKTAKIKKGEDLLSQFQTFGNEGNLQPFSIANPNQDASVVDLRGKKGTVQLLTTEEEQKKRDEWMQENGFNNLTQINSNNVIDGNGNQPAERTWGEAALRTAIGEAPGLTGVIGSGMLNFVDETIGGIENVVNEFTSGNNVQVLENANKLPGNIVVNSVKTTVSDWVSDKTTEISFCPLLNKVPGANELHKYLKLSYDFWENKKGK